MEELKAENERLRTELKRANAMLRQAKDISPVIRPSWKRVIALVREACLTLERLRSGWWLKMGHSKMRRFKSLKEIWDILTAEEWFLSDIFPPAKPTYTATPKLPYRAPVLLPYKASDFNRHPQPTTQ